MKISHQIIIILGLVLATPTHAEIYKWTDENGRVHYSDTPHSESNPQFNVKESEPKSQSTDTISREERRRRLAAAMEEDRLQKQAEKQKAQAQKEELNQRCVYAKDRLKQYEAANHLYNLDKNGNRINMSDEDKDKAVAELRAQITQNCK